MRELSVKRGLLAGIGALLLLVLALVALVRFKADSFASLKPQRQWARIALVVAAASVGKTEAYWDRLRGRYAIKEHGTFGHIVPSQRGKYEFEYERLLEEKYRIDVDRLAGSDDSLWLLGYGSAYNEVAGSKIMQLH
jgi:hypothetical protein